MFETLSDKLSGAFNSLRRKGFITEADVNTAMREVRVALLEADVALPVAKTFINNVKEKALGEEVVNNVNPAQMVIKIVQDEMTALLGHEAQELNLSATPPVVFMMVGLQGSGKTTSTSKLALWMKNKSKKKVLMASLDTSRPAAQEQLETLGKSIEVDTLEIIAGQDPIKITERALKTAKLEGYDVVMLDTAGRLHVDDELMKEVKAIEKISKPTETLLVADALTGQDAVTIATHFNEKLSLTGIILTRMDGDGRGGAALAMKEVTGCPIKFIGVGERPNEFEPFHPERIATRILGMGDVVSLVEKAVETADEEEALKMAKKMKKGQFDYNDLFKQMDQIKKMGGMGGIMSMLPGMGKLQAKMDEAGVDESIVTKQQAIIQSMTKKEREKPELMNASRKKRIAAGSGTEVQDVNRLIKQHKQMQVMMKKMGKMNKKDLMRQFGGLLGNN